MSTKNKLIRKTLALHWTMRKELEQLMATYDRPMTYVCVKCIVKGLDSPEIMSMLPDKRKAEPTFNMSIGFTQQTLDRIKQTAQEHERSVSFVCRKALEAGLIRLKTSGATTQPQAKESTDV